MIPVSADALVLLFLNLLRVAGFLHLKPLLEVEKTPREESELVKLLG